MKFVVLRFIVCPWSYCLKELFSILRINTLKKSRESVFRVSILLCVCFAVLCVVCVCRVSCVYHTRLLSIFQGFFLSDCAIPTVVSESLQSSPRIRSRHSLGAPCSPPSSCLIPLRVRLNDTPAKDPAPPAGSFHRKSCQTGKSRDSNADTAGFEFGSSIVSVQPETEICGGANTSWRRQHRRWYRRSAIVAVDRPTPHSPVSDKIGKGRVAQKDRFDKGPAQELFH